MASSLVHEYLSPIPVRRRSNTCRKPRTDLGPLSNSCDRSPLDDSTKQLPGNGSNVPSSWNVNELKIVVLKPSPLQGIKGEGKLDAGQTRKKRNSCLRSALKSGNQRSQNPDLKQCTDDVTPNSMEILNIAKNNPLSDPPIYKNSGHVSQTAKSLNVLAESRVRKMKLKIGGVTHTVGAESAAENGHAGGSDTASGIEMKITENGHSKTTEETMTRMDGFEAVRKSGRVHKKRSANEAFDNDDDRCLPGSESKDNSANHVKDATECTTGGKKKTRILKKRQIKYCDDSDYELPNGKNSREGKKPMPAAQLEDSRRRCSDALEGKEMEEKSPSSNIVKMDPPLMMDPPFMTRRRALLSSNGVDGLVEFPNGLPSCPKRQKVQLSDVEKQVKKAEAAKRRKMQLEKAAKESEAAVIRKILGVDSSKKRKDKLQREQAQREARSSALAPGYVRWVFGPSGTRVIFPEGVELPSMFQPCKPDSYPPPREKCAGPSCSNPYKYRDSKTNLPLCSLQCYRAVRQNDQHC